ncbi:MAG: hypothetical protein EOO09_19880 [Chitinophagaceae bacterium]|nr:MAG: hypothetical protein EOO09_19880 [Chitinophagaceae bacterium]
MKKLYLPLIFCLLVLGAGAQQDPVYRFTKSWYRSNPFISSYGAFVEHVLQDPDLINQRKQLRTDSTLFVFNATFASYNPFSFKPSRVDVALVEQNAQLYEDRPEGDTIMLYVLMAFADSTPRGADRLKKEYDRITRKSDRMFSDYKQEAIDQGKVTGVSRNYFVDYAQMAPVTIEFVTGLAPTPILRITVRIRSRGNEAVLPMSLYDTKPQEIVDSGFKWFND